MEKLEGAPAKVPEGKPNFLSTDEVGPVLAALDVKWQPLFATAIYTGLRKGELFALQKIDADLTNRLLKVGCSHGRNSTRDRNFQIKASLVPGYAIP